NPDALVVATGCYVQTDPDGAMKDPMIDLLVGNNRKREIVSIVEEALSQREKNLAHILDLRETVPYEELKLERTLEHTRADIKVQDGCDQFCSYCIIPFARGRSRSRKTEQVVDEIRELASRGYREVVLTGIHLSSYGIDLAEDNRHYNEAAGAGGFTNEALLALIRETGRIPGIERIRLGSLEPRIITERFLEELAGIPAFCDHFHLSLQSGSDSVLQRMNRHYTAAEYLEKTELIRRFFPQAAITTDVIVGFPGETEEEFMETRVFLDRADLYETHVFKYSRRKGTAADRMDKQLTEAEKNARSAILIGDSKKRQHSFMEKAIGTVVEIIGEEEIEEGGKTYMTGFTKNYIRCAYPAGTIRNKESGKGVVKGFLTDVILEVLADS
ncbi:MAG: MiaB/RimO family radical SAM methylthiotransferase, partial [Lachnospiraceae bacterium]|nr:MiaB/RimO family radical SAM methylthiotransferase [Lachnospiraceae bacterium]